MPKVLAIESSTTWASVAVLENKKILAEMSSGSQRTHSEFLNHAIDEVLKKTQISLSQIDIFATGIGPGSFTGIRVALNIAKTFSYLYQKPIYACDSLAILQRQSGPDCLTMINAFKNMVYWCAFKDGKRQLEPKANFAVDIENQLTSLNISFPISGVGDGYIAYEGVFSSNLKQQLVRKSSLADYPRASRLAELAEAIDPIGKILHWNTVLPLYIRASEAEENLKKNP